MKSITDYITSTHNPFGFHLSYETPLELAYTSACGKMTLYFQRWGSEEPLPILERNHPYVSATMTIDGRDFRVGDRLYDGAPVYGTHEAAIEGLLAVRYYGVTVGEIAGLV